MKVILDLEKYTVEYLETTPFIQGTDSRNKIEVLVPHESTTDIMIAYTLASGRSTIAMANKSLTTITYNSASYDNVLFELPSAVTRLEGNICATVIVTLASDSSKHKFNILNTILNSTDFETFEDALTGTAAQVLASLAAMNSNLSSMSTNLNNHTGNTDNPHSVTKAQVGLGNCNNTSDADKPISDATQAALDDLQDEIDDLGVIAEMPDKIIDVANCFDFTNDEAKVSVDEVETPKIGKSKNSNKNTIEFGDGYGYNNFTFKTTDGTNTDTITLQDLVNMAQGKTSNYVIDTTTTGTNTYNFMFDSVANTLILNIRTSNNEVICIKDIKGNVIPLTDLKIGDIISIKQSNVPDRWVGAITSTQITFISAETKVDLIPTLNSGNPVASGGVYNALLGKVDKSEIGYYAISSEQTEITNQDDDYSVGSDYDEIRAEFRKPYCIIREVHHEDITGYHDNDVYYIKYKTDLYMNNEGQYYHYFVAFGNKNNNTDVDKIQYLRVGDFSVASGFPIGFTRYSVDLEAKSNKTTAISSSSTDSQYPSAKAVYDFTQPKVDKNLYNLGSFDSVSGNVITRQTGYGRLEDLNWTSYGGGWYSQDLNTIISKDSRLNIQCANYTTKNEQSLSDLGTNECSVDSNGNLQVRTSDSTLKPSGAFEYKLATPYTENIIDGQPLNTLDQKGSEWLRNEWEKGLNLFNINDFEQGGTTGVVSGNSVTVTGEWYILYTINVKANTNYYVSYNASGTTQILSVWDETINTNIKRLENGDGGTFNTGSNTIIKILLYAGWGTSGTTTYSNIMLTESDHAYPYQAYNGAIVHEKDITPVLLWENASPNSALSSGNITTQNKANYKYIIFAEKIDNNQNNGIKYTKYLNGATNYYLGQIDTTTGDNYHRMVTVVNDTTLAISEGYINGSSNNTSTILVAVYGSNY